MILSSVILPGGTGCLGGNSSFNKDQNLKRTAALMVGFPAIWEAEGLLTCLWAQPACSLRWPS